MATEREPDRRAVLMAEAKKAGRQRGGGKPSTTRSAIGGAAGGAATGAALGSVVPVLGTTAGAAAGGALGGVGGVYKGRAAKAEWRNAQRGDTAGAYRALVAEFAVCIVILALSPLAKPDGETKPKDWMKRGSAMCGVFIVLGLISSAGPRAARVTVAFGGLVTLALLLDQREIFAVIAKRLRDGGSGQAGEGDQVDDVGTGPGVGPVGAAAAGMLDGPDPLGVPASGATPVARPRPSQTWRAF